MEDLTDREIVLRLAREVMGWKAQSFSSGLLLRSEPTLQWWDGCVHGKSLCWNPLESHDAVAEALAKLPEDHQILVGKLLGAGGRLSSKSPQMCCHVVLTATPREKCLAILKALG